MYEIDKIKEIAKEQGKSMSYICEKLNVTTSYFNDVIRGKNTLKPDRLAQIADILDTTPEYLKGETDIKEKAPAQLSELEQKMLEIFRSLSEEQQKALLFDLLNK